MVCRLIFLLAAGFFASGFAYGKYGDTVRIKAFDRETIVTDPSKGTNNYRKWAVFPSHKQEFRKMVMKVTMGCPDTMRCADWDYMDRISLRRKGGVSGKDENYELGRMLTPYGGAFPKGWNFTWQVDVTDFSLLLRDSVEVEYTHNGWEPNEDRGWAVTVEFELIEGTPDKVPVSIRKLYDGTFPYGDSANPITKYLTPVTFEKHAGANEAVIRIVQTGHGMDKPDGCGEFCDKFRDVFVDGELLGRKSMWKECGDNPLYPQAGTWPIDRANWCPGDLIDPDLYVIPLTGRHTFQIQMEEYTARVPEATEVISAYLIQYKTGKKKNAATLHQVISPNGNPLFARENPASSRPVIEVKNPGSAVIESLQITYGTRGFTPKKYIWKGIIGPHGQTTIELPGAIEAHGGQQIFDVSIDRVNGRKDAYAADNQLHTPFSKAPVVDSVLILSLLTNKNALENSYTLTNAEGDTLYQRQTGTLRPETDYRDTFRLQPGAYEFTLHDTAGNGLEFWFATRAGRGVAYLLNAREKMVKSFESDFGSFTKWAFYVGGESSTLPQQEYQIGLFPTRTVQSTTLDYFANDSADVTVQLIRDPGGAVLEEHIYHNLKKGRFVYDLGHHKPGRFYIKVFVNGEEKFIKRVRYRE